MRIGKITIDLYLLLHISIITTFMVVFWISIYRMFTEPTPTEFVKTIFNALWSAFLLLADFNKLKEKLTNFNGQITLPMLEPDDQSKGETKE
jgi:uncharacterized membrane protein YqhA